MKEFLLAFFAYLIGYRTNDSFVTDVVDEEYDFIIVGGGTSGVALAGRLSEDPTVKVLVIEAGKTDRSFPRMRVPASQEILFSEANWDYDTVPQRYAAQALLNKTEKWPRGKILGGTSSVNHLMYHRGSPHDYDSWEDHGAAGWNWKSVEPYFMKAEGAVDDSLSPKLGRNGPVKLTKAYSLPAMTKILEEAGNEIGIRKTDYVEELEGLTDIVAAKYHGLRMNSVEAYLRNEFPDRKDRLQVLCEAYATKILLNETGPQPKAIGVEYKRKGEIHRVFAKKEVILSAGAIGSPQLMMLSGIGPKNHLEDIGIPVAVDAPGVGSNMKDHIRVLYLFYSDKFPKNATLSDLENEESQQDFIKSGDGTLSSNHITSYFHYRTPLSGGPKSLSTVKRPFPEIQLAISPEEVKVTALRSTYDVKTYNLSDYVGEINEAATKRNRIIANLIVVVGLEHIKSVGTIRLKSANAFDPPLIDPNFFSDRDDVDVMLEGMKLVERLRQTETFRKLNVTEVFQPYCKEYGDQIPRTDEFLKCRIQKTAVSKYHACSTAKIGTKDDPSAVVDERLKVYGVTGLRVVDSSVMPHETSGNPQAVCYMIAEKAADMIKEDWSLPR